MLAELVAGMRGEGVDLGQLLGYPSGELRIETTPPVDSSQLVELSVGIRPVLHPLGAKIGAFHISLGAHRHVLAHRHGHRARRKCSEPCREHGTMRRVGCGHSKHEARRRDDTVVGAEHCSAQPPGLMPTMALEDRRVRHAPSMTQHD